MLLKSYARRRHFVMRNVASSSALLIVMLILFHVETCTTNASHKYSSYDDGIHSSMSKMLSSVRFSMVL